MYLGALDKIKTNQTESSRWEEIRPGQKTIKY